MSKNIMQLRTHFSRNSDNYSKLNHACRQNSSSLGDLVSATRSLADNMRNSAETIRKNLGA